MPVLIASSKRAAKKFATARNATKRVNEGWRDRIIDMSKYFTAVDTDEGSVHILTKTRGMGFVRMPHTSVTPRSAADMKRLGSFIEWSTNDAAALAALHESVVRLVQQHGAAGLVEIGNMVKTTERVASAVGGDWHDIVRQAAQDGLPFPIPDEVLKHVKSVV